MKNHTQNAVEKLFPDHFLENQNWAYLWINILKFYIFCFYCLSSWGLPKVIETKLQTTRFYFIWSFFKKRDLELVSLTHFLHDFWRRIFLLLNSITWPYFNVWLPLLREILDNMCIVIVCWPGCDVLNFQIIFIFLIKPVFFTWPKTQDKNVNILRKKRVFKMK